MMLSLVGPAKKFSGAADFMRTHLNNECFEVVGAF